MACLRGTALRPVEVRWSRVAGHNMATMPVLEACRFGTPSATWCCPGTAVMLRLSPIVGSFRQSNLAMLDLFTLHHVSLYVRDVDASATFYATVLGLQEIPNRVGKNHIRWFIIDGHRT